MPEVIPLSCMRAGKIKTMLLPFSKLVEEEACIIFVHLIKILVFIASCLNQLVKKVVARFFMVVKNLCFVSCFWFYYFQIFRL